MKQIKDSEDELIVLNKQINTFLKNSKINYITVEILKQIFSYLINEINTCKNIRLCSLLFRNLLFKCGFKMNFYLSFSKISQNYKLDEYIKSINENFPNFIIGNWKVNIECFKLNYNNNVIKIQNTDNKYIIKSNFESLAEIFSKNEIYALLEFLIIDNNILIVYFIFLFDIYKFQYFLYETNLLKILFNKMHIKKIKDLANYEIINYYYLLKLIYNKNFSNNDNVIKKFIFNLTIDLLKEHNCEKICTFCKLIKFLKLYLEIESHYTFFQYIVIEKKDIQIINFLLTDILNTEESYKELDDILNKKNHKQYIKNNIKKFLIKYYDELFLKLNK